ncbi:heat shock protein beta-6 [Tachyglossus aculeatus]|uniref:heat shock protein beta-6 n=1 Tax=Tachyglossus aculeatus TaxID=9261 RepID=UPI0018F6D75E|nr:heat shock protein beta-6 [Tachyglossus aculeatus]
MDVPVTLQPSWLRRPLGAPGPAFPSRLFDQRFGEGLLEAELAALGVPGLGPTFLRAPGVALRPEPAPPQKDHFSVLLDVKHFSPEEISVKVVDGHVEVHARHEERQDEHGFITREFHRRYRLPAGVDGTRVTSALSPEGILAIEGPPSPSPQGTTPTPP